MLNSGVLRSKPKVNQVLAEYEDFHNWTDPVDLTDRDAFQRLTPYKLGYRLTVFAI